MNAPELTDDPGLIAFTLLARLHGKPVEAAELRHKLALNGPLQVEHILQAGKLLGLRAAQGKLDLQRCAEGLSPLPCLVEMIDPRIRSNQEGGVGTVFALLAAVQGERVLLHDTASGRPCTLPVARLLEAATGRVVFVTSRQTLARELARFDFTWFIPAIVKYRRSLGEATVATLALQLFALSTPLLFQAVMDKVLVHQGYATLTVIGLGWLACALFESLLSALRGYVLAHTTSRMDVELGAKLMRHLLALPLSYFEARRVGDSIARVRELEHIRQFLTGPALSSAIDLLFTAVFLAVMLAYSVRLTLLVVLSLPCYAGLMLLAMPVLRRLIREKFARGAENQAFLVESVTNIHAIKSGATEPRAARRWDDQLAAYVSASFRVTRLATAATEGINLIQKLTSLAVLWVGAYEVIGAQMSVGELVAFNMLANRVAQPVLRLAQLWQEVQQTGLAVARLGDILNTRAENTGADARARLPSVQGAVSLEAVHFRYRADGPEILRAVSLNAAPGEILGIVGRSGSGKSTLAKLVQKLYLPERGRIMLDGMDIALADPAWLRTQVGVVLQEARLFAGSIRDNIAFGATNVPLSSIVQAAHLAGAHEFIVRLPEAYDTPVGEQGATLSGGQRQRIALARVLLANPRVLILDEATSALDVESERIIHDNMEKIAHGRTLLIITHRLTALAHAHRIVVMEAGEIVEQGAPAALLSDPTGHYARLHAMQRG
ncbi:MAG: type I secretion system permease/ATPase [Rhodocyclaceae bacterium]|nr:type I secretion system permease/ATPase [Rhodocyclaceae bacterium]MBX3670298.1 type I secretion system permease/ATPase [Rhodocyclaceae bacterium]